MEKLSIFQKDEQQTAIVTIDSDCESVCSEIPPIPPPTKKKRSSSEKSISEAWRLYESRNKILSGAFTITSQSVRCNLCVRKFSVYKYARDHHMRSKSHIELYEVYKEQVLVSKQNKATREFQDECNERYDIIIGIYGHRVFRRTSVTSILCSCGKELNLKPVTSSYLENVKTHRNSKACEASAKTKLSQTSLLDFVKKQDS